MICTFERTVFENKENGYCIVQFQTKDESVPHEARIDCKDKKLHFKASGYQLPSTDAIDFDLSGKWEKNKYGTQFVIESFVEVFPKTIAGIFGYLSSGVIKGVGEKTAQKLVDKFGMETLDILENEPERLLEVKTISSSKLEKIIASYKESTSIRELLTFLSPYGVTPAKVAKIKAKFEDNALEIVKTDPFQLCTIKGFAFKTVDAIARKASYSLNDTKRISCAITYVLEEAASNEGHLFIHQRALRDKVYEMLNHGFSTEVVSEVEIYNVLCAMIKERQVVNESQLIFLPYLWAAENDTAYAIFELLQDKPGYAMNIDAETEYAQRTLGITLSATQIKAVRMCFENKLSVITGGPGTGKTTVLKTILKIFGRVAPDKTVLLTAPTGIAARRMADSTGYPLAMTMHSALGIVSDDEDSIVNGTEDLEEDIIIADEVSMMDMRLAKEFFTRIKSGSHTILVGDPDQLPSVGPGRVLREIIGCGFIPVTSLDTVFRQAENSRISLNAQSVNKGETKLLYGPDFEFIDADSEEAALERIKAIYRKEIAGGNLDSVQILSPMRKRDYSTGTETLNETLQVLANPPSAASPEIKYGGKTFRLNDKVIQIKNKNEISNGDIGYIRRIYQNEDGEAIMDIEFSGGRTVTYGNDELAMLDLAYALTVHKSQGSEFKTIIMPILKKYYCLLRRNLVYTGITRAKNKVILIGQRNAMHIAVHKNDVDDRNTLLGARIKALFSKETEKRAV